MTALEKMKICADAIQLPNVKLEAHRVTYHYYFDDMARTYDPIHFDHQAMALKKKFRLADSAHMDDIGGTEWIVRYGDVMASAYKLNEAIVDCVVRLVDRQGLLAA